MKHSFTFTIRLAAMALIATLAAVHSAALTLPQQIGDNMVLQQKTRAALWGWAKPKSTVKVKCSWTTTPVSTTADSKGRWLAKVPTVEGNYNPQTITIEGDKQTINLHNVLIGEVWFASGQSNMEMTIGGYPAQPVEGSDTITAFASEYSNKIRMATLALSATNLAADSVAGAWKVCNPENVSKFSAVGYFFAETLNRLLDVPVGIIACSWGGSYVEGWLPEEAAEAFPEIDDNFKSVLAAQGHSVSKLFNGMVSPLRNYTIRGFLWNQGESNASSDWCKYYAIHFSAMLQAWRNAFNQGDLPMYCVEIPGWRYDGNNLLMGAFGREEQWKGADMSDKCEMVSVIDCMHPDQSDDIHGSMKRPVGERLAFMAAAKTYGLKNMPCNYSRFTKADFNGNTATLHFTNAANGFTPHDALVGFEVAGADKRFYPATATEVWQTGDITVTSPKVKEIKAVRYCFKNWVIGKIYNSQWLPLVPFRTDNWD